MIKFFRKIRQNLLTENKTSPNDSVGRAGKYFKYAIGKIVLVMIGILLALAINNWNTDRQLRASNKVYLNKMLNDLSVTKARLHKIALEGMERKNAFSWPSLKEAAKQCDSLLKLTYKGLDENDFDYLVTARINAGGSLLNIPDNTYTEMLNTGKIYTLKSDTLTTAITGYYKMCQREADYNVINTGFVERGINKYEDGFGKLILDYDYNKANFKLEDYPFYSDSDSEAYKDFQIGLNLMANGQESNMRKMIYIIEETEKLIATLTNALKQYD